MITLAQLGLDQVLVLEVKIMTMSAEAFHQLVRERRSCAGFVPILFLRKRLIYFRDGAMGPSVQTSNRGGYMSHRVRRAIGSVEF